MGEISVYRGLDESCRNAFASSEPFAIVDDAVRVIGNVDSELMGRLGEPSQVRIMNLDPNSTKQNVQEGDKRLSSVDHRGQSVVDAIQWTTAKVFGVSLHDLAFGTSTLHINDYAQQLRLARMAGLYLCRKHTELAGGTIARAFNRRTPAVAYAVRSIGRLITEEPRLGELLSEVEREFGSAIGTNGQA